MSYAPDYTPSNSFADDEANQAAGRSTVKTDELDAQFAGISSAHNALNANVQLNQRDDGEIRDQRVKLFTLAPEVLKLISAFGGAIRGAWVTATAYALKDVVTQGGNTYVCAVAHTSGVFATDLAAVPARWVLVQLGAATAAAGVPFSPTPTLAATNVQDAINEADTENRALSATAQATGAAAQAALAAALIAFAAAANPAESDAMLGAQWTEAGAVATTQHQINEDAATVMAVINDSLKVAIRALSSSTDLTSVVQAYFQLCYDNRKPARLPAGQYSIGPIVITCNGGNFNKGFKITGEGQNVTRLRKIGSSASPLITFQSTTPGAGTPPSIQLMMRDLTIDGVNETGAGLCLDTVAKFDIQNIGVTDCTVGIELKSALIGTVANCKIVSNQIGIRARRNGASAYCNKLTIRENQITNNTIFGVDVGDCDTFKSRDNQYEENGVNQSTAVVTISIASPAVVTWAAHGLAIGDPVRFSSSGALPTGMAAGYCYYVIAAGFGAGSFQFSAVKGGASIVTTLAGSGTHTATSPRTGAVVIRDTTVVELGSGVVLSDGDRYEGNRGSDFRVEYTASAFGVSVDIRNAQMAGTNDGPMILIGYARKVALRGCWAPVGSSTWSVCAEQILMENCEVINYEQPDLQPAVQRSWLTVFNSRFNGDDHIAGRRGSYTTSLTGCTTVPTGTVSYVVQGRRVTSLSIASTIQAVSNTTDATLIGMPSFLCPTVARTKDIWTRNNGTNDVIGRSSVGTNGVITLGNGNSSVFTNSGNKGVATFEIDYEM